MDYTQDPTEFKVTGTLADRLIVPSEESYFDGTKERHTDVVNRIVAFQRDVMSLLSHLVSLDDLANVQLQVARPPAYGLSHFEEAGWLCQRQDDCTFEVPMAFVREGQSTATIYIVHLVSYYLKGEQLWLKLDYSERFPNIPISALHQRLADIARGESETAISYHLGE